MPKKPKKLRQPKPAAKKKTKKREATGKRKVAKQLKAGDFDDVLIDVSTAHAIDRLAADVKMGLSVIADMLSRTNDLLEKLVINEETALHEEAPGKPVAHKPLDEGDETVDDADDDDDVEGEEGDDD